MTQEVVDRLLVRIKSTIFTTDPPVAVFSGANQDPQDDFEKNWISKPVSKEAKVRKTTPQGFRKTPNIDPRISRKRFLQKNCFLQYLPYKQTLFQKLRQSLIDLETSPNKT